MSNQSRRSGSDFNTLTAAGNAHPAGIWSDGATIWVSDNETTTEEKDSDYKVYSYNLPRSAALRSLTVSPKDIIGFIHSRTSYHVGVDSAITTATVTAKAFSPGSTVEFQNGDGTAATDADPVAEGHQVTLSAGRNPLRIVVRVERAVQTYYLSINRGVKTAFGWKAGDDLDGLLAAGNTRAEGIWSDGTTTWVADSVADKIFAYNTSDGSRDSSKDFDSLAAANNNDPRGIWSDGSTMWVADSADDKIYAYSMADKFRDTSRDFNGLSAAGNLDPRGIWSDNQTMWVMDSVDLKIYAYSMLALTRDMDKDFDTLNTENDSPHGITSDGTTMWVADSGDGKIYAYKISDESYDSLNDFNTAEAARNNAPTNIFTNETTMWAADRFSVKLYAYNQPLVDLRALTVGPSDIADFVHHRTSYEVGQESSVATATVSATAFHSGSTVEFQNADGTAATDADTTTDDHQVTLTAGRNRLNVKVTAPDGVLNKTYELSINRGVAGTFGWKASDDLDVLIGARNNNPVGIWSNPTTVWVLDNDDNKIYAYKTSDLSRDPDKDFDTLEAAGNEDPRGIWSDGMTMWVTDGADEKIYAYAMSDQSRNSAKEFNTLAVDNDDPRGIWSDGATLWVADVVDGKIYSYAMANRSRDSRGDFNTLSAAGNAAPTGIWSNGVTMWVADAATDKIYAYKMLDRSRDSVKDFNTLDAAGNNAPEGIWSDTNTMWVVDSEDDKVYSYNQPPVATLRVLKVTPNDITAFLPGRMTYEAGQGSTVTTATVIATPHDSNATVEFLNADDTTATDADTTTDNHQITLTAGRNRLKIKVTASDTAFTETYELSINRAVADTYGWTADDDLDGLTAAGNIDPQGIWTDGETMWVVDGHHKKIFAYKLSDNSRDPDKDFNTLQAAGNTSPKGIWSDGSTMWVLNQSGGRIFAYKMNPGETDHAVRDQTKEFGHRPQNPGPWGIWSDGRTMWTGDDRNDEIQAYRMSDMSRHREKVFSSLFDAGNRAPRGIYSDGETIWVTDYEDDKLYAYRMADTNFGLLRNRRPGRDFNTLNAAGNNDPRGMTSNGTTVWVVDGTDDKIYAYKHPPNPLLETLTLSEKEIIGFLPRRFTYEVGLGWRVATASIVYEPQDPAATVTISSNGQTVADGDSTTDGHQVSISRGRNHFDLLVTAPDGITTRTYVVNINRGSPGQAGWNADQDMDGLIDAENLDPGGIWTNGTTIWVADDDENKIYAYSMSDKYWDPDKDFETLEAAGNEDPKGIWSNDTTMWVADSADKKLYAYSMSDMSRDSTKDFNTLDAAGNDHPRGIWSNGTTMWVADSTDKKLYAYSMSDMSRDNTKDFDTLDAAGNDRPYGIWSDGTLMWVADELANKIFAYKMSNEQRYPSMDFGTLHAAGNRDPRGIWGNDSVMWVVDGTDNKVYSYNQIHDATLSTLTVKPKNIIGFTPGREAYHVGLLNQVTTATVNAEAFYPSSTVAFQNDDGTAATDADTTTEGFQVDLATGGNILKVVVTARNGTTRKTYTLHINRGVTTDYGWKAGDDLDGLIAADNRAPAGIWSNGTTMWVADSDDKKVYAYKMSDMRRDSGKDFNTLATPGGKVAGPTGIWSDTETMWVADASHDKIFAYKMSDKSRDTGKDFETLDAASNNSPGGIWSDGQTMWVLDTGDKKIYAYKMSDQSRNPDKDFNTLAGIGTPRGIWSNGETMWVADEAHGRLSAYRMSDKGRDTNRDYRTLGGAGNANFSAGVWSDGTTMWVADTVDDKVYSYNNPLTASLVELTVSPKNITGFEPHRTSYEVGMDSTVTSATVEATGFNSSGTVAFQNADGTAATDADTATEGFQINLSAGRNLLNVVFTVGGTTTTTYELAINRGVTNQFGWKAGDDLDGLTAWGNEDPTGIWSNGTTLWVADLEDSKIYAYKMSDMSRDPDKDFDTLDQDNDEPRGIWSNGETMWVADRSSNSKVYAYKMSDMTRDSGKDFITGLAFNNHPVGLWSNGETMWVVDDFDNKIYAYSMSNRSHDSTKDFNTLAAAGNTDPSDIWSDGTTMWVADATQNKVFAYKIPDKSRDSSGDFNTLAAAGNEDPRGIWSNRTTTWVTDLSDGKIYSYNHVSYVTASFGAATYAVAESDDAGTTNIKENEVTVTVTLSADPERSVPIPITATGEGGASSADYSGVPASVTFAAGETSKTFTFTATADTIVEEGESVNLAFGALPAGVIKGTTGEAAVSITDDDAPVVTVSFGSATYTVAESDDASTTNTKENEVTVTVSLSADPERSVTIPLTTTNLGNATGADYSGVPASVTFAADEDSKTFTFSATADTVDDDDESVRIGFGVLPDRVTAGMPNQTTVSITDDDDPDVTVSFGAATYTVAESDDAATTNVKENEVVVTVTLSADPERTVTIPLTTTNLGNASDSDYSGVPANVVFNDGETSKTFTFSATGDTIDDDDESVRIGFGATLPAGVTAASPSQTTVSITDDDDPDVTVSFGSGTHTVAESDDAATTNIKENEVTITVTLSAAPERSVTIPLTTTNLGNATNSDYSGVPTGVTFGATETSKTFTFSATADTIDDDDESVRISFGSTLPAGVTAASPSQTTVSITDDDDPAVTVSFGSATYSVDETDDPGTTNVKENEVVVTVSLSADPERTVTIPLTTTNLGNASDSDYSGVPASLTFAADEDSKTFTFTAALDAIDDDESVRISFGVLPAGVSAASPSQTTVSITDDDDPAVTVSFGSATYSVAESDDTGTTNIKENEVVVTVSLSADPERSVTIPLTTTNLGGASSSDYSGVPASVTFAADEDSKTFTFKATADTIDDDGESVRISFGSTLPAGVSAASPSQTTVSITDDDDPDVTVSFGSATYSVAESDDTGTIPKENEVTVTVRLSADPERTVTIPLTTTNLGNATNSDYSGVPASVVLNDGETWKTFIFSATADTIDDDDESVRIGFGATLPAGVTAASPSQTTVSITDDDDPDVTVSFGSATYTVAESDDAATTNVKENEVVVTVSLSADPERTVTIPLNTTNLGNATNSDYSGVPANVVFNDGDTSKTFTFKATGDTVDEDNELVRISFGSTLPAGVSAASPSQTTVSITDDDDPAVTVSFGSATYSVAESDDTGTTNIKENEVVVTVSLSADPERSVTIPLTTTNLDGAASADYSGVPASVTFAADEDSKTFTFKATADTVDDDGESVRIGFGTSLPAGVSGASPSQTTVSITDDDDPDVTVSFGAATYTVAESDDASTTNVKENEVVVTVSLSADPERSVTIPLSTTNLGNATNSDYSGVPASVIFAADEDSKTFTFKATADTIDDDDESVRISFGSLPAGVSAASPSQTTVSITDDDDPAVTVSFGSATYSVAESDDAATTNTKENEVTITVSLSADPERTVTIPLNTTNLGNATNSDYSGVPANVVFNDGDTSKTFTFKATADTVDEDNELVRISFGSTLPAGVSAGTPNRTTVSITDDDDPDVTVSFGSATYSVDESDDAATTNVKENEVVVTVSLSADPERSVTIPLTTTNLGGAASADYSGVPASVTLAADEDSKTFTFKATADTIDDDDESVRISFGSTLPSGVSAASPSQTTVSITDDDDPDVTVSFGSATYNVAESDDASTTNVKENEVVVTVSLSADPERSVTIPLNTTNLGNASASDYSGVPASVTFAADEDSKTFTFKATADTIDDDDESVRISFGSLPAGVSAASPSQTTVSITDDDDPAVTVSFGSATYTVAESDDAATTNTKENEVTITVSLSADPERTVTIPLNTTNLGNATNSDYSGVPANVVFNDGDTSKTFTFKATADTVDEDNELVRISFGSTLPAGVSAGTPNRTTVSITDDDDPDVTVSFGSATYSVDESDDAATTNVKENEVVVTVSLSADPERSVTIPLTTTNLGGAASADYSGVPASVTLAADEDSKTFTFKATADTIDDDDESVRISFGSTLPSGVSAASPSQTTVSITDDDDPDVTVSFGSATYNVAESDDASTTNVKENEVVVTVSLSADPERSVTIPLNTTNLGNASASDYSGVPASVTFAADEDSKTFTFQATADTIDDDDESVRISFGVLPSGVGAASPSQTTVSITDDDDPDVTVSFGSATYTVAESDDAATTNVKENEVVVTVSLSADPERSVTIPLNTTNLGNASASDYSGVPASVTFAADEDSKTFTFTATADTIDDDGESVRIAFGVLPSGVGAGTTNQTTVSITDDDDPDVTVSFGSATYSVAESDDASTTNVKENEVVVTVSLSADPERSVTIPLNTTNLGNASASDYSGVPASVTFAADEDSKTFTFQATADTIDDDDESVRISFGVLPSGVGAASPSQTTVSITDDDDPDVTVSFGAATYTVAESDDASTTNAKENEVVVTVSLSADPERSVTIPLNTTNLGNASASDYSGVPASVTFAADEDSKTFTFQATADTIDDDDESVRISFGVLPSGVGAASPSQTTVSITDDDDPDVTVSFGAATYTVAESDDASTTNVKENEVVVTVSLSADPERSVTIPLSTTNLGNASASDYSGVPASVTFAADEDSKTFTFQATADTIDDDDESVRISFGVLPSGVGAASPSQTTVSITDDDDPDVTVSFGAATYTVAESDDASTTNVKENEVVVTVSLSADPERSVTIPLSTTNLGNASASDYSGVPASVTFAADEDSKTFTFTATADTIDDDGESVRISFGTSLPAGVSAGTPNRTTVSITDDDDPDVTVSFGSATYTVAESDDASTTNVKENEVVVTVSLSADPERSVTIPLNTTNLGNATNSDYSGVPASVTFAADEDSKTFTFKANADTIDDDDESVRISFGSTLPSGVSAASPSQTTVSITDDDDPAVTVSFGSATYSVDESDDAATTNVKENEVVVTVSLSADPERSVTIPLSTTNLGNATNSDYSGVPASVTFAADEDSKTFTFKATADTIDDDDESVRISFGVLPSGVGAGTTNQTTVSITDDDDPSVTVSFGAATYTVAESDDASTTNVKENEVVVTVSLSADPERSVTIPLSTTNLGGASASDYSGVPAGVTFAADEDSKTFTFKATADTIDDDDESVRISFGVLPSGVSAGTPNRTTVSITDDDDPAVTVSYQRGSYVVMEGSTQTITVELNTDPKRTVTIPLTKTIPEDGATDSDYSGVPPSLTFAPDEDSKTFTFTATKDTLNDDGESVVLRFPRNLPSGVSVGTPSQTTVTIRDINDPAVTVRFGAAAYSVAEGRSVTITVSLSADPKRTVTIPITKTNEGTTTSADYSGVPANVVFNDGETSKTFTFRAVQDTVEDDGESVMLGFGTLPARVSEGSIDQTTVSIIRADDPSLCPPQKDITVGDLPLLSNLYPPTVKKKATNEQVTLLLRRDSRYFHITGYRIWRSLDFQNYELLESFVPSEHNWPDEVSNYSVDYETYVDTDVLPGVTYSYKVRSVNHEGVSLRASTAFGVTTAADVPPQLRFSTTRNSVSLAWEDPEDDTITGYNILRSVGWGTETVRARNVSANATSYVDRGLSPDTAYAYRVQAVRGGKVGPASRYLTALTKPRTGPRAGVSEGRGRDFPASSATTGRLYIGGTASGTISTMNDKDWFAVDVEADKYYFIRLSYEGEQWDGYGPLKICVRNAQAGPYHPWPNESCWFKEFVGFKSTVADRIYIEVETDSNHHSHPVPIDYTLEIHADVGHTEDGESWRGQAQVGEWTTGSFHELDHVDVYEIELVAGNTYRISVFRNEETAFSHDESANLIDSRCDRWRRYHHIPPLVFKPNGVGSNTYYIDLPNIRLADSANIPNPPRTHTVQHYRFIVELVRSGADTDLQSTTETNRAAGALTITGTARVDETLSADTSGITDTDGLTNATFSYQWIRNDGTTDTDISGATGSTYTLVDADEGKTIKVRVTYTDDAKNRESVTSAATASVAASLGLQVETATLIGNALTLDFNETLDDGVTLPTSAFSVSVNGTAVTVSAVSISGSAVSLTLSTAAAAGDTVTVSYTKPTGDNHIRDTQGREADSFSDLAVTNSTTRSNTDRTDNNPASGAPTITGTARVGETLTASTSGIADADGLTKAKFALQWVRNDGTTDTDISGATASTYTLAEADEGKTVKVTVSFTDDAGNNESLTSAATATVAAALPPLTASVHDKPESHDGSNTFTFELRFSEEVSVGYKTLRDDAFTVTGGEVVKARRLETGKNVRWEISVEPSANGTVTLTLPATTDCDDEGAICAEDGRMLSGAVVVTVQGSGSHSETPNNPATGAPTITGTAQVGETLTTSTSGIADTDGLDTATFSYQWIRNDGTTDTDISGATGSTYTLVEDDEGKTVKVTVSFTDDRGHDESLTSGATGTVEAREDTNAEITTIWSVVMTVKDFGNGDMGAVSSDRFADETGSFRISRLWHSGSRRELYLAFQDHIAEYEDLTLYVGDVALAFQERAGDLSFTFTGVDVSWTSGQTVNVSITRQD